ncbi:WhiB family transcriptional regulator [Nocardioides pocheonensis]|jgi:WhiB family redox-sensing transcriptional regulator|uniref:Transcriptional regulator WhiB n=1 Tax=Nocardioides pocheonensis TaxID=661485 RepID=A0A3N0GQV7_9ACTN|nr:WhiB family transcriptional regulator [Nocardioides pocheonensis]RNM14558.1 WhiB family transcriptional regulator [Nocardioides pocheonensis]
MSHLPCRQEPDLFFAESPRVLEQAQALCAGCPVQELCLAGALERREPHGVWGGKILVGGQVVEHKRGRGRPRKDDPRIVA